jgi:Helicase HerA, central domain
LARASKNPSKLTLGWRINEGLEPEYWLPRGAKPGLQPSSAVITAPTEAMAHHSIIVAQSGSGKSFFLGRLIEELLLMSKSRVLVFDPNSDFRKFNVVVDRKKWIHAKYNPFTKDGALPHESSRQKFKGPWSRVGKRIYLARPKLRRPLVPLQIDWLNFSIDWFADDADLAFQSQLQHCHNFVNELRQAIGFKPALWQADHKLLDFCQQLCSDTEEIRQDRDAVFSKLREEFGESKKLERHLLLAAQYRTFVGGEAERFYFGFARKALRSGIFAAASPIPKPGRPERLHVIDLPSIDDVLFKMMAVGNFLDVEWRLARHAWERALARKRDVRVPLFIVLDEAHNIIPAQPAGLAQRRVKDWFRTIAAEGRKFGVFLILVTQRPDKIDPLIVSECENAAIMKLNSELVLEESCSLLGLSPAQKYQAKQSLSFLRGRIVLFGPWASRDYSFLYSAMRRTEEGGKNLRPQYWARP